MQKHLKLQFIAVFIIGCTLLSGCAKNPFAKTDEAIPLAPPPVDYVSVRPWFNSLSDSPEITWGLPNAANADRNIDFLYYEYSIGSSPGSDNILSWTSAGKATRATASELTLNQGNKYFANVRVVSSEKARSHIESSAPWQVDTLAPDSVRILAPLPGSTVTTESFLVTGECEVEAEVSLEVLFISPEVTPKPVICSKDGTFEMEVEIQQSGRIDFALYQFDQAGNVSDEFVFWINRGA